MFHLQSSLTKCFFYRKKSFLSLITNSKDKIMSNFNELSCFSENYFSILQSSESYIEVRSKCTGQYWLIAKYTQKDFPEQVLYHKHSRQEQYHVHYCYDNDNALHSLSEIYAHDKYILKRQNKKHATPLVSNQKLLNEIHKMTKCDD